MINYKDGELTEEELKDVKAGIVSGKVDETLDKMDKPELSTLKEKIEERELTFNELDNVKAGIPQEMVEEEINKNSNLYRN